MKQKASRPNEQVAHEADEENVVVAIAPTALYTENSKVHEECIREGVHDFSGIWRCVIVLASVSAIAKACSCLGS